jgi:hypothetical protein
MKKIFLNESEKRKLISEKEKMIIESFSKTFNKIKRIDENEINNSPIHKENYDSLLTKPIVDGIKSTVKEIDGEDFELEDRKQQNKDSYQDSGNLNSEINFDRIFDETFSMKPEYEYKETSTNNLSSRYNRRKVSDGMTRAKLYNSELSIHITITYGTSWEEDPDGASYFGNLSMDYEHWNDFGDNELDEMLTRFDNEELIKNTSLQGGISIEQLKGGDMINGEFMSLLSDKTKQKLYSQIEGLIREHRKNEDGDY